MAIKAVLFDLDGTLLPLDQDFFVKTYLQKLCVKMAGHGYDPSLLAKNIWAGTHAMIHNDGTRTNENRFWDTFAGAYGADIRKDEPVFDEYYRNEFGTVREVCGFTEESAINPSASVFR